MIKSQLALQLYHNFLPKITCVVIISISIIVISWELLNNCLYVLFSYCVPWEKCWRSFSDVLCHFDGLTYSVSFICIYAATSLLNFTRVQFLRLHIWRQINSLLPVRISTRVYLFLCVLCITEHTIWRYVQLSFLLYATYCRY